MSGTGDTDLNPGDNGRSFDFTAKGTTADFEAVTASPAGKVGDTVVADLGFRNKGPAVINYVRSGESVARTDIVMPAGVQVTDAPANCRAVNADGSARTERLGAPRYFCDGGTFADVHEPYTHKFVMKIEKAVANAKGSVTVGEPAAAGTKLHAVDPVAGNNTAAFVVDVKAGASASPSTSASTSPSPSASVSASVSASASSSVSPPAARAATWPRPAAPSARSRWARWVPWSSAVRCTWGRAAAPASTRSPKERGTAGRGRPPAGRPFPGVTGLLSPAVRSHEGARSHDARSGGPYVSSLRRSHAWCCGPAPG